MNQTGDTAETIQLLEKQIAEFDEVISSIDAGAPG